MDEFSYELKVPVERIAVVIGKDGETKKELEAATSLTLTYLDKKNVEDPQNQYQAIIVLAE